MFAVLTLICCIKSLSHNQIKALADSAVTRQAYEERRRKKDADREAAEAAQEAEIARAAAARSLLETCC